MKIVYKKYWFCKSKKYFNKSKSNSYTPKVYIFHKLHFELILIFIFSSLFILSLHPINLILLIIIIIMVNCYNIIMISLSIWTSIIIIIALVRGIIILFLYTSSLTSNFKMIRNHYIKIILPFFIFISLIDLNFSVSSINHEFKINIIYYSNWTLIIFCLFIILILINFITKIIYKPFSPLKSSYEI